MYMFDKQNDKGTFIVDGIRRPENRHTQNKNSISKKGLRVTFVSAYLFLLKALNCSIYPSKYVIFIFRFLLTKLLTRQKITVFEL